MKKENLLNVIEESLIQIDSEIYENLVLLAKTQGFSKKRNVAELLGMFELKDHLIKMYDEYTDQ